MFVLLFPGRACSNVSSIGNGLHLWLSRSLEVRHSRRTKYLVRPRASYFASRAGNKTSNGNETFFFLSRKEFHASRRYRNPYRSDHCARRDAERTACPFAEGTRCFQTTIFNRSVFAFSIRVIIPSDVLFPFSFLRRISRYDVSRGFRAVSVFFHYFLSLAYEQCEMIVANEVALRFFQSFSFPGYTIGWLSLERKLFGFHMLISKIRCAIMVCRQAEV